MSNANNLSALANVLDDANAGEFLKSTGSGGVAFDTVAAGAVVYATADLLPLSGNSAGDMAYVTATNRFYINNGSGWYSVSLVNTNPNITSVQDASSNTTPFTLATDGTTATVVTITANDPESVPLTYSYGITNGALNGCTITGADGTSARVAGTAYTDNVFTVTPHASNDATFTITFTASDGINQATSANAFSLSFITIVTDSNYTTLLATATSTGGNSTIEDSSTANSGSGHSITVNGDAHAGSFSPYRNGGYSLFFDGSDYLTIPQTSNVGNFGTGEFTVELWFKPINVDDQMYFVDFRTSDAGFQISRRGSNTIRVRNGNTTLIMGSTQLTDLDTWYHVCVHRNSSNELKLFVNGTQEGGTLTGHTDNYVADTSGVWCIAQQYYGANRVDGYITDLRVTQGEAITPPSGGPTERLSATSNTKFLYSGTGYIADTHNSTPSSNHSITVNGDPETKPFSPYDYNEYSATDHGGSVYFDGTGDYLTVGSSDPMDFGSGDWTISMWLYPTELTNNNNILDWRNSSGAGNTNFHMFGNSDGSITLYMSNGSSYILNGVNLGTTPLKQWTYFVVSRSGSTVTGYINGNSGTAHSISGSMASTAHSLYISRDPAGSGRHWHGYISDLRIDKGTATSSVSVPTSPESSTGIDFHLKGTDASIIDKSQGANLKLVGDTTGSTTQVKFSNTKSMYFDGSGDYIITPQQELGTEDFTIEGWHYLLTRANTKNGIFGNYTSYSAGSLGMFAGHGSGTTTLYQVAYNGDTFPANVIQGGTIAYNQWVHFAVVRNSGTMNLYINGTSVDSISATASLNGVGSNLIFGAPGDQLAYGMHGYLQDFRITKGKARYTSNFTPPSAPLEG